MSCKCASFDEDEGRYYCAVSGSQCMYLTPNSEQCAKDYGEGPDANKDENELEDFYEDDNEETEEICGNPYDDLWVGLKFKIESSDYCKAIREENSAPAFYQALCDKCTEKKCEFINICLELKELREKNVENAKKVR